MYVPPPFMVSYSITTKCNLKCKHCYSDSVEQAAPDELLTTEAFQLIDDLSGWGIGLLIIDGGEPLCRDDLLEILSYASSKGIRTTIGSNGTLIDRAMAGKLLDVGVMAVAISVDGADDRTHDSFRGMDGAFQQTLKGIEACRSAGLPFQLNMIIRKDTMSQLPAMLQLAVDCGANAAEFFDLVASGRAGEECQDQLLSLGERKQAMEWLADAQEDSPIIIRVPGCPMYPLLLQRKDIQPRHFPKDMLRRVPYYDRGCAAGMPMGYVMVLSNGEVNPCMLLQVRLGNIREEGIISIWENSPVLAELRRRDLLTGECGDCSYKVACSGCRGRAYEEAGDMMAADPGCWLAAELTEESKKRLEMLESE
ncbi:MAG: radical SAM protein [Dehalococcoidales bacterium]|nr:MAG: radical SAM protein [Dehalococcoidales bacterium]